MVFFSLLAAVLPTILLVWLIWWADRYEREPTRLLVAAFVWGAIPAIILSLLVELVVGAPFMEGGLGNALAQTAVIAPVIEELIKGLALLGLIQFSRAEIDGMLDGIVYGALVGAGFAMTENFFYFVTSQQDMWGTLVLLRAVVFGLNHIFYTAIFGAAIGYAVGVSNRRTRRLIMLFGLLLAMGVHAFHNFTVTLTSVYPTLFFASIIMNWGGALVMLFIILGALQKERNAIRSYLKSGEAPALPSDMVRSMLALLPPRERFVPDFPWLGSQRRQRNRLYQSVAELALRRQRLARSSGDTNARLQAEIADLQSTIQTLAAAMPDASHTSANKV